MYCSARREGGRGGEDPADSDKSVADAVAGRGGQEIARAKGNYFEKLDPYRGV